ncbi:uncharacterized protein N7484_001235 [Penicillium longicatenatum]|uniref:uncharacterized protein n=1 Tax=Penicillium longicatenatum TaxID=1561947 RepID=UPI0025497233|nr:uncharacterized protein N7484_001235 [Penicillium longicatenatum]KAJ5657586.1 hypothetical protein N7484_001235 [Penicillium longicatenatum]
MIETHVEIAASSGRVRDVLLDFASYPDWQTSGLVRLLEPEDSTKTLTTLQPGDKIKCDIDGMKFTAEIKVVLLHVSDRDLYNRTQLISHR